MQKSLGTINCLLSRREGDGGGETGIEGEGRCWNGRGGRGLAEVESERKRLGGKVEGYGDMGGG